MISRHFFSFGDPWGIRLSIKVSRGEKDLSLQASAFLLLQQQCFFSFLPFPPLLLNRRSSVYYMLESLVKIKKYAGNAGFDLEISKMERIKTALRLAEELTRQMGIVPLWGLLRRFCKTGDCTRIERGMLRICWRAFKTGERSCWDRPRSSQLYIWTRDWIINENPPYGSWTLRWYVHYLVL